MHFLRYWLPVILWSAIILSASNDSFSSERSGSWLEAWFGTAMPHALNVAIRKCAHLVEYAILAALAWRADRRAAVVLPLAFLVAASDETRQAFTRSRTGSIGDVLVDLVGAAAALLLLGRFTRASEAAARRRGA